MTLRARHVEVAEPAHHSPWRELRFPKGTPYNNKMQELARSGHSRWRPSQLILVLGGQ